MNYWYVDREGEVVGPIDDLDALRQLRTRGELDDATSVRREGKAEWQPLGLILDDIAVATAGKPRAIRPSSDGRGTTAQALMGAVAAATRGAAHALGEATTRRSSAVTLESLAHGSRNSPSESPTEAALGRVVAIHLPIGRTPLPGQHIHTLKRVSVLFVAFVIASVMGVYTRGALDSIANRREVARQQAEEQRREEEERLREEAEQARLVEEQYQMLAQQMPPARLRELLRAAGSREALVRRATRDWNGNWTLREE